MKTKSRLAKRLLLALMIALIASGIPVGLVAARPSKGGFSGVVDFKQLTTNPPTEPPKPRWIGSILQKSNSYYYEGMSVNQRVIFTDIASTAGDVHTLTFSHEATKGGIHAYDWLTAWDQGNDKIWPHDSWMNYEPCGENIGPPKDLGATCESLHTGPYCVDVEVPDDTFMSKDGPTLDRILAYESLPGIGNRDIRICGNAEITSASFTAMYHDVPPSGDTGDSYIHYELTWESASDEILIEMAGHLAVSGDSAINPIAWGLGLGSSQIHGGPYHFKLHELDELALGSQDNQIKGADILLLPPEMVFWKEADRTWAVPGDTITYTFYYENIGQGTAVDVVIEDSLPDGTPVSIAIGDVGPGESGTETATWTVPFDLDVWHNCTYAVNSATLYYTDKNDNPYDPITDTASVHIRNPEMIFEKSTTFEHVVPGDEVSFTLSYENIGGATAYATIVDTLPAGLTLVSADPTPDSVVGQVLTWYLEVAPLASGEIIIYVSVDIGLENCLWLENTATLSYEDRNGNPYDPITDTASVHIITPEMTFSKTTGFTDVVPGDTVTFTLSYENTGGATAYATIVDTLPAGLTFVTATPYPDDVVGQVLTWYIVVDPEVSGNIIVTVTVDVGLENCLWLEDTATLSYTDRNDNPYDPITDTASVHIITPIMNFWKVADRTWAVPGDTITYTFYYENTGGADAHNVVISDYLPDGTSINIPVGTVAAGASGFETATWTVPFDLDVWHNCIYAVNSATLYYTDKNDNPYDPITDTASVHIRNPEMIFRKEADREWAVPGDTITYEFYYENIGLATAYDVEVIDTLPDGSSISIWIGEVAPGENGTVTATWTVPFDLENWHNCMWAVNSAWLYFTDRNDNPYEPLYGEDSVHIRNPEMILTKDVDKAEVATGDTLTYTLYYENIGLATAYDVEIVDLLPAGVAFVDADPFPDFAWNGWIGWDIGVVAPGEFGTIEITVRVLTGQFCTNLLNEAWLDYKDKNDNVYPTLYDYAESHVGLGTWVSDTTRCRLEYTDFDIVFTPSRTDTYKISSTNPGQFYFNILFHVTSSSPTITYDLAGGDFVTVGSMPIHAYLWNDLNEDGDWRTAEGCLDWSEFTDITPQITAAQEPDLSAGSVSVSDIEPCNNILITIHMVFDLKKTNEYTDPCSTFEGLEYMFTADANGMHGVATLTAHVKISDNP